MVELATPLLTVNLEKLGNKPARLPQLMAQRHCALAGDFSFGSAVINTAKARRKSIGYKTEPTQSSKQTAISKLANSLAVPALNPA